MQHPGCFCIQWNLGLRDLGIGSVNGARLLNRAVTLAERETESNKIQEGESARLAAREPASLETLDSPTAADGWERTKRLWKHFPEAFLMRTLSRVGGLTRGQSHDLRRCGHEADAVCFAFSAPTWLSRLSMLLSEIDGQLELFCSNRLNVEYKHSWSLQILLAITVHSLSPNCIYCKYLLKHSFAMHKYLLKHYFAMHICTVSGGLGW